jgi:hypothetical protein
MGPHMTEFDEVLGMDREMAFEAVRQLPFVAPLNDGDVAFWSTEGSGHVSTDLETGESFARLAIDVARSFDLPILIAFVLRDIAKAGRFTGLEAGFIAVIASAARAGSMN